MFRAILHVALKLSMEVLLINEGNRKVEGILLIVAVLKTSQGRIITSLFTDKNGHFSYIC